MRKKILLWLLILFSLFEFSFFVAFASVTIEEEIKRHSKEAIIFIHGFRGGYRDTWTASSGFYWPSKLLDERAAKNYDVLVVNYATGCYEGTDLIDVTTEIENKLIQIQKSSQYKSFVIIAHSMGGLITRQLLINRKLVPLRKIFFLGVPNMGSKWTEWVELVCHKDQLKYLEIESPQLDNLNNQWRKKFEVSQRFLDFSIQAAYGLGDVFVSKASALSFAHKVVPINKNHGGLAKPESEKDENYKWIQKELGGEEFKSSISSTEATVVSEQFQELYKINKKSYKIVSEQLNKYVTPSEWLKSKESNNATLMILDKGGELSPLLLRPQIFLKHP